MNAPIDELDQQIIRDLTQKAADDVSAVIHRTIDVCPRGGTLSIIVGVGVAALSAVSVALLILLRTDRDTQAKDNSQLAAALYLYHASRANNPTVQRRMNAGNIMDMTMRDLRLLLDARTRETVS